MSEGQKIRSMSTNHGIVKFGMSFFKRIRHAAAKNRNNPSGAATR
jgi:hypothetical protein